MNEPTFNAMQDDIQRSKLEQARRMTPGQKLLAGPELFDMGLVMMRSGIRTAHPEFTEEQVQAEVVRRLKIARRIDDGDRFRPVENDDE